MTDLTTLASFDESNGLVPIGGLTFGAGGLYGATTGGGANGDGVVFEIAETDDAYSDTPSVLYNIAGSDGFGATPSFSGLTIGLAAGLYGVSTGGGQYGEGAIFVFNVIPLRGANGYENSPLVLASFDDSTGFDPTASLLSDAADDLFGTTNAGGASGDGTVFELTASPDGFPSAPTALGSFGAGFKIAADATSQVSGLVEDAAGDLFGVFDSYEPIIPGNEFNAQGVVFELAKTAAGYASAPTALATVGLGLDSADTGGVVIDANGDLFGETSSGGADGKGSVFEIVKTSSGYASTAVTLVSFDGADGADPVGGLLIGAGGTLYGDTNTGGASDDGVLFAIANLATGYADTPTVVASFDGANGSGEKGPLIADAAGDLFGAASGGGANGDGAVFELAASTLEIHGVDDFQAITDKQTLDPFAGVTISDTNSGATDDTLTVALDDATYGFLSNLAGGTYDAATGVYSDTGSLAAVTTALDGLVFTPTIAPGVRETTTFDVAVDDGIAPVGARASTRVEVISFVGGGQWVGFGAVPSNAASLYDTNGDWDLLKGDDGTAFLTSAQVSIFGGGDIADFSGGDENAVSFYNANNDWDTVNGDDGTVYLTSAQASVVGHDDSITVSGGSGNQASLYNTANGWDGINGSDALVYFTDAQASVSGGGDALYLLGNSGNAASLYVTNGNWDGITGSDATVYFTDAQASVSGGGDALYLLGNSGNAASLYATNGNWDGINGSDATVYFTDAQASVLGGGDTLNLLGNSGNAASLYATNGSWDGINGSDATVYFTDAQASVFGGGDMLNLLENSGNAVSLYDTGANQDIVTGSDATLYFTAAHAAVTGGGDTLNMLGSSDDATALFNTSGAWDTVNGSGAQVYFVGAQASVIGGNDTLDFYAGTGNAASLYHTDGASDTVSGSGGAVTLNNAQASVSGDDYYFYFNGDDQLNIGGNSEMLSFQPAIGAQTISGFNATDTMQFSASDFANFAALQAHLTQSGANAVITLDANDSVTLTNVQASNLTAAEFKFM